MSTSGANMTDGSRETLLFSTEHLGTDLKGRSVRGGAVTALGQGARFALGIASTVILARLLTPKDFGLIAMVTAVTGFIAVFQDLGLSMATVQKKEISHAQVSTLFWINVTLGLAVMMVAGGMAPAIAWFYGEPRLTSVTWALAAAFLFGGLAVQHQALLRRQMRFGALAVIDIVSAFVGIAVGVVSAFRGAGYWALVMMHLATAVTRTVAVWIGCRWRPGLPVRGSGVRPMLAFGGNLAGFSVVNYFARNLDNILIGRVWGARSLGFYSKAYNLLMLPLTQINSPVGAVAIPALSRLQEDAGRFRDYYLKSLSVVFFFTAPLSLFCVVLADELILTVLGPQWLDASGIFRLLAIGALVQPICNTSGWLYVATGRTREMLKYGSIGVGLAVTSFFVGLPYGAEGVALSYSCAVLLWTWPCMYFAARGTAVPLGGIFKAASRPVLGALLGAALLFAFKVVFGSGLATWLSLIIGVVLMGSVYCLVMFYLFRKKDFYLSVMRSLKKG